MKTEIQELRHQKNELDLKIKDLEKEKKERIKNRKAPSNIEIRVSHEFDNELKDISKKRLENKFDKISKPKTTKFIIWHKFWKKIKEDMMKCDPSIIEAKKRHNPLIIEGKKGQLTITLTIFILVAFLSTIILFGAGVVLTKVDQALDQDIQMGQVNLRDINDETFGVYVDSFLNNADWWGLSIIVGMILGLMISSYLVRNRFPKIGIILDIFVIFISFIVSLYISSSYQIILDSLQSAGEPFLEVYAPKTSFFILNLPIFIVIIGTIIMVLFHSSIPKKDDEKYQRGGYLQGV